MMEVNEGTRAVFPLTLADEYGVVAAPASARFRIDDVQGATLTQVADWAALPAGSAPDLVTTPANNAILDQTHEIETRLVTVQVNQGTATQANFDFVYVVRNLRAITS